jgi:small subunit ribosomal protein S16
MIKIRLSRTGSRNNPFYRIVAIEDAKKLVGAPLEILGFWHPAKKMKNIDNKKIDAWIKKGAVLSDAVTKLIK